MTAAQQPIGSGFSADTTIADVLAGLDLTGQLAIVTGDIAEISEGVDAFAAT